MAAPNVNGRLHLTGVHKKPPASFANFSKKERSVNFTKVQKFHKKKSQKCVSQDFRVKRSKHFREMLKFDYRASFYHSIILL